MKKICCPPNSSSALLGTLGHRLLKTFTLEFGIKSELKSSNLTMAYIAMPSSIMLKSIRLDFGRLSSQSQTETDVVLGDDLNGEFLI